ncbi:hypothetical protein BCU90_17460 [Vibrio lentus]|uniref:hypothetical protein n=1 Tax=Vibrio lentus TaxID=136468 RepID=UPI000C819443|nr:hypothetical protein [Vibrio lentus]PMG45652.1 hypothetical protein BCU90_17460 [Vibrio lentus]
MINKTYSHRRPIHGVGINDANYHTTKCPYYIKWAKLMERCYSEAYHRRKPSYREVTVCDEWHVFSSFRGWCIEQEKEVGDISKLELDKDLLSNGSKVYSPSTCCFLPKKVNMFIQAQPRGKTLMGVVIKKNRFGAYCNDTLRSKRIYVGSHLTELRAFQAYILKKVELAREIAYHTDLVPQRHVKDALAIFHPNLRNSIIN